MVTVGEECKNIEFGSSVCEIHGRGSLYPRQLVYGLMINSGNDAAMTIAVHIARVWEVRGNDESGGSRHWGVRHTFCKSAWTCRTRIIIQQIMRYIPDVS